MKFFSFILRQLAESPNDAKGKHVFVIDTKNHVTIKSRLEEMFFYLPRTGWPRTPEHRTRAPFSYRGSTQQLGQSLT